MKDQILRVGFTGTQRGMEAGQAGVVRSVLWRMRADGDWLGSFFHHGDCVGADCTAHDLACEVGYRPIIHPPENPVKRAWCKAAPEDIREPKPYLDRNKDIVAESDAMIAAPGEKDEQLRSGTWSTIRHARKLGRRIVIVFPDGTYSVEADFAERDMEAGR